MIALLRILVLTVLLGLTACAGVLGNDDPFAIPQPFQGVERNDDMINNAIEVPALVIDAPAGLDELKGPALRDQVVKAARNHDIPALNEATVRAWFLTGQMAELRTGQKPERDKCVISWTLIDAKGEQRSQFAVTFDGSAKDMGESAILLLGEQTAVALEAALLRPRTQVAQTTTAATADRPTAWVGAIKGAPGDGNEALSRSLNAVLPLKGVRIKGAKADAEWIVEGIVKVVQGSPTQDVVTLSWRITDASGREAGTITQQNAVAHGRLAKKWAELAGFAAEAAAEGIAQLIQQVKAAKAS